MLRPWRKVRIPQFIEDQQVERRCRRFSSLHSSSSVSQVLERLGYRVTVRTSSVDALELFRSKPYEFELVITDMTMPRMTGDRLAKQVLKIRPGIPVIICTGYSERMSVKESEALGVRKYIEKPIGTRNLAAALREALDAGPNSAQFPMQDGESKS